MKRKALLLLYVYRQDGCKHRALLVGDCMRVCLLLGGYAVRWCRAISLALWSNVCSLSLSLGHWPHPPPHLTFFGHSHFLFVSPAAREPPHANFRPFFISDGTTSVIACRPCSMFFAANDLHCCTRRDRRNPAQMGELFLQQRGFNQSFA